MIEYKRLVSYMHSYIGGVRDKNIGFTKIEVRGERLIFNVSIRGMYAGASGTYGIYLLVDRKVNTQDKKASFSLLKISEINIQNGTGQCNVTVNPEDIIGSAYNYYDIEGIAIKADEQSYYTIFSLWNEEEVDVNKCNVLPKEHKKNMRVVKVVNPISEIAEASPFSRTEDAAPFVDTKKQPNNAEKQQDTTANNVKNQFGKIVAQETKLQEVKEQSRVIAFPLKSESLDKFEQNEELIACEKDDILEKNRIAEKDDVSERNIVSKEYSVSEKNVVSEENINSKNRSFKENSVSEQSVDFEQTIESERTNISGENEYQTSASLKNEQQTSMQSEIETNEIKGFEKLFVNADTINVFCDDDLYDCIEVTPQQIEKAIGSDETIAGNSFLIHGYYNFKHILLGRVADNDRHTKYFIGVPGIYCNRERYMASMFGFVNFKKSHRSDYANPHFGYWYQEI